MPELPTGTVTFLFTDIEGSTRLLHELGAEAYSVTLADHRRVLRKAFIRHGGVEVDTQGDAFFVAFATASAAVAAAREVQGALAAGEARVRIGVHTGTAALTSAGYVGVDVHIAARIAAAASGGQILLSAQTRGLIGDSFEVLDLGHHQLKDFDQPVRLYQLDRTQFPPLRTIANTNLPRALSAFVGRQREVDEIKGLVAAGARLVTLTGPGGTGKTRLAIEAAAGLVARFADGTFWVDLSTLHGARLVGPTMARVLGGRAGVADLVGEREMLMVLDNFEQVIEASPELVELLSTCPNLRLLATSREVLRIRGEVEYPVPPLATEDALQLFRSRSGLEPDDVIAELCRRLDDLPLAVELAAARTSVLSPRQLVDRLGTRLDLLKGRRDSDPRQQTLRATIEWSHDLLSSSERRLFARLAVFAGGFDVEAAETICEADIDTLQALVDKNLLRHEQERFALLETIHAYAIERLDELGDAEEMGSRHSDYFLARVVDTEPVIVGPGVEQWLDGLEADLGNLRAAIDRLQSTGETELALRMTGSLWSFWNRRGHLAEGLSRLATALAADLRPTAARAKALNAASELSGWTGEHAASRQYATEALDLYRSLDDAAGAAWSSWALGMATAEEGDFELASELLERSVTELGATGAAHERLAAVRSLAWVYGELNRHDRARRLNEDGLVAARALGNEEMESTFLGVLATAYAEEERVAEALTMLARSLALTRALGDHLGLMVELSRVARVLSLAGRAAPAAQVLSRADSLRQELGATFETWNAKLNTTTMAAIRAELDDARFATAWADGSRLTIEEAIEIGLAGVSPNHDQAG
ncbi:MAG: adenylate/guanylate cyclase domain-containing protein [Candidatus Limnocylindrales bacterium]